MEVPLQITFHDVDHSPSAEEKIRKKAKKLETFFDKIISMAVVVEKTQNAKHQGKLYDLHIKLNVPNKEMVVKGHENEDLEVAIRDSFDALQSQVEKHAQKIHGEVKSHAETLRGQVVRMPEGKDFGFIEGVDGTEYYFNADCVTKPAFNKFKPGMDVTFVEFHGDEGLQARKVSG